MKYAIYTVALFLTLVVTSGFTSAKIDSDKVVGTWEYLAEDAPYEYSEGNLVFVTKSGKVIGHIVIDGYKIDMENVELKKGGVSFEVYVEGESIAIDLKITKKSFKGTASFSEGILDIEGKKIK